MPHMGNVHVALPWGGEGGVHAGGVPRQAHPGTRGDSMSVHFHDGAERWENEVVLIVAALFA